MGHKTGPRIQPPPSLLIPDLSRHTLDVLLGTIWAPVVDGVVQLPQLAPVDSPLPAKLARDMAKWLKGRVCAVCGGPHPQAHHLFPRHIWPQLMWDDRYWFPLDRDFPTLDCHCVIGHGSNFSGYNPFCVAMAEIMRPTIAANKLLLAQIRAEVKNSS